jgi:hypothetical protein
VSKVIAVSVATIASAAATLLLLAGLAADEAERADAPKRSLEYRPEGAAE